MDKLDSGIAYKRMKRYDITFGSMTVGTVTKILEAIKDNPGNIGYKIASLSGVASGNIYAYCRVLDEKGFLKSSLTPGGRDLKRHDLRAYTITEKGETALKSLKGEGLLGSGHHQVAPPKPETFVESYSF